MHMCMFRFHFHIASQPTEPTRVSVLSDQSLIRSNQIRLNRNMKQSELGIRMATVGLRFWARFPTETYRCPALLVQMAFLFCLPPDRSNYSRPDPGKGKVKGKENTTTPAMVLGSERELLSVNKKQEEEIKKLKRMIKKKNKEVNLQVEKLMDLCLNKREEIKSLKSSFPDDTNSQLQELVEKQGSELKEVKQVIPSLRQQVSSLTDQLQSLAEDLAEVTEVLRSYGSSPRTPPPQGREDASNF